ncbi:carboxylating nicotinate-nucleotide diphosphorylase [Candidatus Peregrinibacteria bacterium]|jgi:nicotinate-nucleotide pyrophosphorylase (carboxylating)|nr:carboxylating nicotinate-nucleotide diphosphorylase [Candidatus Peregrinibacteria bacterium]MBT7484381.1 carboxylating nicotinate-nucleotide diphosphorylase [Candidatus Peregrinibacteria bacterium]MBT7703796.1 carboxylating nicotinate-nucleotide diphosphorylase [Candidatus Peregrinibacteria bacterium]
MQIHPYDRSHLLCLQNPLFVQDLERYFLGSYESDVAIGDVTEEALRTPKKDMSAVVVAKNSGVFCGGLLVEWFFKNLYDSFDVKVNFKESEDFKKGDILLEINGPAAAILRAERTLLNVLQRLCGIATLTDQFREKAGITPVAATRKTLFGLLDKYAVAMGGGLTHRLNLGDAPLFKENHLSLLENDINELMSALPHLPDDVPFVTIEIETVAQYEQILSKLGQKLPWPLFLMFDNFAAPDLTKIVADIKLDRPDYLFFEASGGINLETVGEYAKTGVDVLSVGALTHSVLPIDLSLQMG